MRSPRVWRGPALAAAALALFLAAGALPPQAPTYASATAALVADINRPELNSVSSNPGDLVVAGELVYFSTRNLDDGTSNLWRSDGSAAGTIRLGGFFGLGPGVAVGSVLFFAVGDQLWVSDGMPAGTRMVYDMQPGADGPGPAELTPFGDRLAFVADDGAHGSEIWVSDGTAAGTTLLKDAAEGPDSSGPRDLTVVGTRLHFVTRRAGGGAMLWCSDGTTSGTIVTRAFPWAYSNPRQLTAVGGALFFTAAEEATGIELWRSDGTRAGTAMVRDINGGAPGSNPEELTALGEMLVFSAYTAETGGELWRSDGTHDGTVRVSDVYPGPSGSKPGQLTVVGCTLFFIADTGGGAPELWRSDGTHDATARVLRLAAFAAPAELTAAGDTLYFVAADVSTGRELWASGGAASDTFVVADLLPGPNRGEDGPAGLTAMGSTLFFAATAPTTGRELYAADDPTGGVRLVIDLALGSGDSAPAELTAVGEQVFFVADDGVLQRELWTSDGSAAGTVRLTDTWSAYPDPEVDPFPHDLYAYAGALFFGNNGSLARSDGTPAGTGSVIYLGPEEEHPGPTQLTEAGGKLYFQGWAGIYRWGLYVSDGTEAGTMLIGRAGDAPRDMQLSDLGGTLYFVDEATDLVAGPHALWRSDGSVAGTAPVRDGLYISELEPVGDRLFFVGATSEGEWRLWVSDGTSAGTAPLAIPFSGADGTAPYGLTSYVGRLFFIADDGVHGRELWASDGTLAGTAMVRDIAPGPASAFPAPGYPLVTVGGRLFLVADDGMQGRELWASDGTLAGTALVAEIAPGGASAFPEFSMGAEPWIADVGGTALFAADDSLHGRELWASDATSAGTRLVQDIAPGAGGSDPAAFTVAGERVYFRADDGSTGVELWAVAASAFAPPPAPLPDPTPTQGPGPAPERPNVWLPMLMR